MLREETPESSVGGVLRILDERGRLIGPRPDLSDDQMVELHRTMVAARAYDEKMINLQRAGRVPHYYQASGQEATTAAALALAPDDWFVTAYREPGLWFLRGLSMETLVRFWQGVPDDGWDVPATRVTRIASTIGTHLSHATGIGYATRQLGRDDIVLCTFGDGATSTGDFHCAVNFAGVWKTPTIFLVQNNQYTESTPVSMQTASETLAQKGDAYGVPGVKVDGMDPLAVYSAIAEAVDRARSGAGPTLVESLTYRFAPHSSYDGLPVYRTREEEEEWRGRDPLLRMEVFLTSEGLWSPEMGEETRKSIRLEVERAIEAAEARPIPSRAFGPRTLNHRVRPRLAEQIRREQRDLGEALTDFSEAELFEPAAEEAQDGETTRMSMVEAIRTALGDAMETRPETVILGEDVATEGGVFRATEGLLARFGASRVIDTPLSETGILGSSVGMAMAGLRPVAEIMFSGFVYIGLDQIIGHFARMRWRTQGKVAMPIVVRFGAGGGHQGHEFHSDHTEALFAQVPGLTIVYPSNPYDAKGLLAAALESEDPVLFYEPILQYNRTAEGVPVEPFTVPIGRAKVARAGSDATIVTYGNTVPTSLEAAALVDAEGISVEVIDLRTLLPWDEATVLASVEKTGRLITVHEGAISSGFGAEIVSTVSEKAIYSLLAPPERVGHADVHWGIVQMEGYSVIPADRIAAAVRRAMES